MKGNELTTDTAPSRPARSYQLLDALLRDLLVEVQSDDDPGVLNSSICAPITQAQPVPELPAGYAAVSPAQADWAQSIFSVLKFRVGETEWAAPLVLLECVARAPEALTVLPGQPVWHLGVALLRNKTRVVIDLSRFLALENPPVTRQGGYLIAVGDGAFMLHCDTLGEAVRVTPETVGWRRSSGTPWLAGVLPDSLSALLDVDWLIAQIRHD